MVESNIPANIRVRDVYPEELSMKVLTVNVNFDDKIFYLISSYLTLIEPLRVVATRGLKTLASYRLGVLDMTADIDMEITDRVYEKDLVDFGHKAICYNCKTYIEMLITAMTVDLKSPTEPNCTRFITAQMAHYMDRIVKFRPMRNAYRKDIINSLATVCYYQASNRAEANMSIDVVLRFFEFIKSAEFDIGDYREEYFPLLRVVFYLACAYYQIVPSDLSGLLRKAPDYQNNIKIMDTTLAAVPPSPAMLNNCADRDTPTSTNGIMYLYAINEALRCLPHVNASEAEESLSNIA